MRARRSVPVWLTWGGVLLVAGGALAADPAGPAPAKRPGVERKHGAGAGVKEKSPLDADAAGRKYFTDTEVVDQHGKRHRFYSDLLRNRKVLINFAFTSCKTACSPVTANLARVQKQLGARLGKEVWMLTLSVDPVNDTPATLRRFAEKFKAQPGWLFLTGTPDNLHLLLGKLGGDTPKPEEHSTALLIGDTRTGVWVKTVAMDKPESIVDAVLRLNEPLTLGGPHGAPGSVP